jgi:hypothetical protein
VGNGVVVWRTVVFWLFSFVKVAKLRIIMSTKRFITVLVKRQTTINAEMRGRLTMFSECELSHINEESEEEGIWLENSKAQKCGNN